jgi:hypothetical protein|tara:strand:+ start:14 stop:448 length:435 start_codon:yes stop_codon:yes gene_type:complete
MNFLVQCLISYSGLIPYFYLLIDLFFIETLNPEIIYDIMLYHTLLIFTFIGATNWDLKNNYIIYTIYGFIPSLIAFVIMVLNVLNYDQPSLFIAMVFFLLLQLIIDYFSYLNKKISSQIIYYLRVPITLMLSGILLISIFIDHP